MKLLITKFSNMRNPQVFTASEIATWHISEEFEPGKWRPARCCAFFGFRPKERFIKAWRVFTGRWDALDWEGQSGEWTNSQVNYRDFADKGFIRAGYENEK